MNALSKRADPLTNFSFRVTIIHRKLGHINCGFNSVSAIGVTGVYKEYREGGNNTTPDLLLESVNVEPVLCTKGMTVDDSINELASLFFSSEGGLISPFSNRFDVIVDVMDRQNKNPVKTYEMRDCVIEQFILGELNAMGDAVMIESFSFKFNELMKK